MRGLCEAEVVVSEQEPNPWLMKVIGTVFMFSPVSLVER